MKVCIAEKPSVAREIATILGAKTKRDGYFEGNGYAVTYTFGHLCTLLEPADYKPHWKSWDLNNLPMLPEKFNTKVNGDKGIQKQYKIVKSLFDKADVVINCGDAGQEGELIQRWVIKQAGYKGVVKRLWISSLTEEAIKEGFNNLEENEKYDNLYYAGFSRAIGDWLLGLNATRLYTVKFGGHKQVLSIGRVQTPTLAMLVNRYLEIQNFKPQPYWELQTTYRETIFNCEQGRFLEQNEGQKFANKVKDSDFEITKVQKKKGKDYAPKLFDLTGLQVYCNNKFSFSADETLKIVQRLYEMKVVTYPRVDTTFLPNDIYPKVPLILKNLTNYSSLTTCLINKKIRKSIKVFNDKKVTDHHAIIPTGVQVNLQYNQQQVYDIITRRFIAVFYPDSDISNTTVLGEVETISFKATGKEIITKGWRIVFEKEEKPEVKKEQKILPTFEKGEKGSHEPSFLQKETKPPRNYTDASLLRSMETAGKQVDDDEMRDLMKENGIGRPSTRASIIETLFRRKYIKREKKQIIPTQIGINLINLIDNELLKSPELTGLWEKKLKEIERGQYHASTFINQMKKMVDNLVYEVRSNNKSVRLSAPTISEKIVNTKKLSKKKQLIGKSCPKCKTGKILKGKNAFGCNNFGDTCNFKLDFKLYGKKITENQLIRLLDKGSTTLLKGFIINDIKQNGYLILTNKFEITLKVKEEVTEKQAKITCPKCEKGSIIKGKKAYGCSLYNISCNFSVSFETIRKEAKEQKISKNIILEILEKYK